MVAEKQAKSYLKICCQTLDKNKERRSTSGYARVRKIKREKLSRGHNIVSSEVDFFHIIWTVVQQTCLWECFLTIFHLPFRLSHFQLSDDVRFVSRYLRRKQVSAGVERKIRKENYNFCHLRAYSE